jgi:hypothetical protein
MRSTLSTIRTRILTRRLFMLMRCMVVQMAWYWRTCSMGMADSCGMAFTNAHIQDQLQCSLMEMRKHGRKACTGTCSGVDSACITAMCRDWKAWHTSAFRHEYSEKGQTPSRPSTSGAFKSSAPGQIFLLWSLPFLALPFKLRKLRTQPHRQDERT